MDTKVFLQKINELKEALSLPNTFRNHFVTFGNFLRKEEKEENGNKINLLI